MPGSRAARERRHHGFTLIEILAVVAILALMTTFVAPNLGAVRDRRLRSEAQALVATLELARQRSVVTGVPHRVLFDLDERGYQLQSLGDGGSTLPPPLDLSSLDLNGSSPLPLSAPEHPEAEFQPLTGMLGRFRWLPEPLFIAGVQTPDGWIDTGDTFVEFAQDGTASYTEIVLEDDSGRRVRLAVLPLDDAVRWLDEDA